MYQSGRAGDEPKKRESWHDYIVYAAQGGSFESNEEILKCDHNNESSTFLVLFLML